MNTYRTDLSESEKQIFDGFDAAFKAVPSGPFNSVITGVIRNAMRGQYPRVAHEFDVRAQNVMPTGAQTSGRD